MGTDAAQPSSRVGQLARLHDAAQLYLARMRGDVTVVPEPPQDARHLERPSRAIGFPHWASCALARCCATAHEARSSPNDKIEAGGGARAGETEA